MLDCHRFTDYMMRIADCLILEKDRALHYLHPSSEPKLLERVQHELISILANLLPRNKDLGCLALLRDGKVDDLSRMFRQFYKVEKGLEPVSQTFTHHVIQRENTRKENSHSLSPLSTRCILYLLHRGNT